jgi:integrase
MTIRVFEELRNDPKVHGPDLARFRSWYRWAAIMEMPGFDPDVSEALRAIRIGANPRGKVARKKDPEQGPLNDAERQELLFKTLEASDGKLPLRERVAVLLSMGLGANSGPLSLLQVEDYTFKFSGGTKYCLLRVPRHKKGFERERSDFRLRQIDSDCAQYLERLIAQNRATVDHVYERSTGKRRPPTVAIPVFMRDHVRTDLQPSMEEYALHLTPLEFTGLLQNASGRLNIRSRFGGMLRINARRLRSTFATNLIADGKSTRVVAAALDHSSTQYVAKYEFANHRLTKALDARIGDVMGVVAQAFLGTLSKKGGEPARRPLPSSTIRYFNQEEDQPDEIGNCGQDHVCGRAVPLACYSCPSFQAWTDAPHEKLLAQLERERARKATSSMHPRIVQLNDRDIQAVSEVVSAIASLKSNVNGKKTN